MDDKTNLIFNQFIILIILVLFDIYYAYLILFDKLTVFMHPKMLGFAIFAFIIMLILTLFQTIKLFKKASNTISFKLSYLLLFLPLLTGFLVNPEKFSVDMIKNKSFTIDKTIFNEQVDSDFFETK